LRITQNAGHSNLCSNDRVTRSRPIRYDRDTWLVMRDDKVTPKAVIRRYTDKAGKDQFLLIRGILIRRSAG